MAENIRKSGIIVDVLKRRLFQGTIIIADGKILDIVEEQAPTDRFIIPGFIDSHVHIESSMLVPSEFARLAVVHGTVATVSDPHEIANVLGIQGVNFMIENAKQVPFHFFFGAPSCVPATPFETTGAHLGLKETETLLTMPEIRYLSEMMNFPGVLSGDKEVMEKLLLAGKYGKPVDGHAPGLIGEDLKKYAAAGITTDHECYRFEEAVEKINAGMKILIREGSAAKNFEELILLMSDYPDKLMFCSDDKHPNDLVRGHINLLASKAIQSGYDWMNVLRSCSCIPAAHYGLPVGLLQAGDTADFAVVNNLSELRVSETWIRGRKVAENGISLLDSVAVRPLNNFQATRLSAAQLQVKAEGNKIKVQKAFDGQLITALLPLDALVENGLVVSDVKNDILKMVVVNRYKPAPPAIGFTSGFGLTRGALASSVSHDSHNIVAIGSNDDELCRAVNLIIDAKGGISYVDGEVQYILPLPVAGLMSDQDGYQVADLYEKLDQLAKMSGSNLQAPYMTLSFMALLVIPSIKLSDMGLFDGEKFTFTDLFVEKLSFQ